MKDIIKQKKELEKEMLALLRLMDKVNKQAEKFFENSYVVLEQIKELITQQES